jgi:uncharacterized protein YecT (DUF1311 family)
MNISIERHFFAYLIMAFVLAFTSAAHADGPNPQSGYDEAYKDAQEYQVADDALVHAYQQLLASLSPQRIVALRHDELVWLRQRNRLCTVTLSGAVFINFKCVTKQIVGRAAVLNAMVLAPNYPESYNGQYTVPGTAMPWLWNRTVLNVTHPIGNEDGTGPVVLNLAGLKARSGQWLEIHYLSGQATIDSDIPSNDANGTDQYGHDHGGNGFTGLPLPSEYMAPYPINLGALVGAFADKAGQLVGPPFFLGDGPTQKLIPAGATQFQLGINDDSFSNHGGSFVVAVNVAKEISQDQGRGSHGCAIFGGSLGSLCQDYPSWPPGYWKPPVGIHLVHVLLVGAGGSGWSNPLSTGVGGSGGASGKAVVTYVRVTQPVEIVVGQEFDDDVEGQQFADSLSSSNSEDGAASSFGNLVAAGGSGGQFGQAGAGSSGGGGGGGGFIKTFPAGSGGDGGTGGSNGKDGQPMANTTDPWHGIPGGVGDPFPKFDFKFVMITAGARGKGGTYGTIGDPQFPGGGGGGGGGGGVLINGTGPTAASGATAKKCRCRQGQNGDGGSGYGAGGGGAAYGWNTSGGVGDSGVVYVEW